MKSLKWRALAGFIVVTFIFISVFSISYAAGSKKMLEAWFGTTNIRYNDQDLTTYAEPFSWNQTTYIPLRKMADIFNKNISWDQATQTVILTDKLDPTVSTLRDQVVAKDYTISQLEAQIKSLQAQLAAKSSNSNGLDGLKDNLSDEFSDYRDVEFSFKLSGDEDDITVKIGVDLDDFEDEWKALTSTRKQMYLQDVADYILDEYEDADVEGYIYDSSGSGTYKLLSFTVKSNGDVSVGSDLDSLESQLNDDYYDAWTDMEVEIGLEGDEQDITYTVSFDLSDYDSEWSNVSESRKKSLMVDIYNDIADEFEDADIEGYIYDTDQEENLYRLYKNSSGTLVLVTE